MKALTRGRTQMLPCKRSHSWKLYSRDKVSWSEFEYQSWAAVPCLIWWVVGSFQFSLILFVYQMGRAFRTQIRHRYIFHTHQVFKHDFLPLNLKHACIKRWTFVYDRFKTPTSEAWKYIFFIYPDFKVRESLRNC